mgnify:CR=1 FL=1
MNKFINYKEDIVKDIYKKCISLKTNLFLEQIKNTHGVFDFALRSHSSANDRVCYKIKNSDEIFDNPLHYSRSFKLFMDNLKPKYAVPFASNHCHLHKDVRHFNEIINDPYNLLENLNTISI